MNILSDVLLMLCAASLVDSQLSLPRGIRVCKRNGPLSLSECAKQSIELLRPSLRSGNYGDGFKADGIDPLTIDDITVRRQSFQADLKKLVVTGASSFVIKNIKVNFDNPLIDIQVVVPEVVARGYYENTFGFGWLNQRAKGRIINQVGDLKMRFSFRGQQEQRNGRTYIKFNKFEVRVKITKIKIKLENPFPDRALSDAVNSFINQNTELFLPEVEAAIRQTLGRRMRAIVLKIFDNYPLDVVYPS